MASSYNPQGKLLLVASYHGIGQYGSTQHLAYESEERTLCGRLRRDWMLLRDADLRTDMDSPWTCKRCVHQVTK